MVKAEAYQHQIRHLNLMLQRRDQEHGCCSRLHMQLDVQSKLCLHLFGTGMGSMRVLNKSSLLNHQYADLQSYAGRLLETQSWLSD